jgi:hypothetical protein
MKIGIALCIDTDLEKKSNLIYTVVNQINDFLKDYDYGQYIEEYLVGLHFNCYPLGFECFYNTKSEKPKYIEHKIYSHPDIKGMTYEVNKTFSVEINIEDELYLIFLYATEFESQKIIATEIFNSFSNFDLLPKKVKCFDKERFKNDVKQFLIEKDWFIDDYENYKETVGKNYSLAEYKRKKAEENSKESARIDKIGKLALEGTPESLKEMEKLFFAGLKKTQEIRYNSEKTQIIKREKTEILKDLNMLKKTSKFDTISNKTLRSALSKKFLSVIDDFIIAIENHSDIKDVEYQNMIRKNLSFFEEEKSVLDTEEREQLCQYFEDIMDIIDLESSGGALNEWLYGLGINI